MNVSDYDYELPEKLIAQYPSEKRGGSRMLAVDFKGNLADRNFTEITSYIDDRYFLILNDTSVVPARLRARKPTGGAREIFFLEDYHDGSFNALIRGKTQAGDLLNIGEDSVTVTGRGEDGSWVLSSNTPVRSLLEKHGEIPLPPYIQRNADEKDKERYQTVYAANEGSVAAPTAGLHFTDDILAELASKGVEQVKVTLHVGIGTFRPIQTDRIEDHHMHSERYFISTKSADRINEYIKAGKIPLCVGTTTVRAVESAAVSKGVIRAGEGSSTLFIKPGYDFKITGAMITNFHLPRSSLMLLVAGLIGRDGLLAAYRHAVDAGYRFYSYGDAMLILPAIG